MLAGYVVRTRDRGKQIETILTYLSKHKGIQPSEMIRQAIAQPTRVQDLLAVNVTSKSQTDRVNRNAYIYSVVMLILFICK